MLNAIIDGISLGIFKEFGEDYNIYTEKVTQGLTEPCFIIFPVNPSMEVELKDRYSYKSKFAIDYFPKNENSKFECNDVLFRLYKALEVIEIKEFKEDKDKKKLRGTNINSTVADDILHFFVNYDYKMFKRKKYDFMEDLETKFI